jgi:dihydrodipicolinate synthase/N-acetylneuraminate lyase
MPPSLSDYTPTTRPIMHLGKVLFEVAGLSLDDITYLITIHKEDILDVLKAYDAQKVNIFSREGSDTMILMIRNEFPNLAAEIIACAAGQRDQHAKAAKLPLTAQISALAEILGQTFEDAGGLKNLVATLGKVGKSFLPAEISALLESRQAPKNA